MAKAPSKIGKYPILSEIGQGGMGAVYIAEHPTLNRKVVIKRLILTGSTDFEERFRREAQIMMDFRNENIVQVYDHFKERNAYHIVMEYVDGTTLENLIREKRFLENDAAMLIFREICNALQYAHDKQVIHRDIKPANILISREGIVKLVDFGVSTSLQDEGDDGLTKAGMTIGTPSYLAPEQIANAKRKDRRADIYSMGVLLYEMVVGKKPFPGSLNAETIRLIEKGKYILPRKINPKISSLIQSVIRKAMHHRVRKRYEEAGDIAKKFSRKLKVFSDTNAIRYGIKAYMEDSEKFDAILRQKKGKRWKWKLAWLGLFLLMLLPVLGAGGFWGYQQGYHYEYIYPDQFGALQIHVKARKDWKKSNKPFIKSTLFAEKKKGLNSVSGFQPVFRENPSRSTRSYFQLESNRIYLPTGNYRIKFQIENEQFQQNFYLAPRKLQQLAGDKSHTLQFSTEKKHPNLPLKAAFRVEDLASGASITELVKISISYKNRWMSWQEFQEDPKRVADFVSGERYYFRFDSDGYYRKKYTATVRPEQTRLDLTVKMIPIPGTLKIKAAGKGYEVLLNNSNMFISGNKKRDVVVLNELPDDFQLWSLAPGEYFLTVRKTEFFFSEISETQRIEIKQEEELTITVDQDKEGKKILFNIQEPENK